MKLETVQRIRKYSWVIGYLFFAAAGVFAFFVPSRAVEANLASIGLYAWAAFFFFGGLLSALGVIIKQWWGEMVGLPLISSGSAVYGAAVFAQYFNPATSDGAYLFVGTLLFGFSLSILERWVDVIVNFRLAVRSSR